MDDTDPAPPTPTLARRSLGYLELVRLPNVFTAMADPAMGFLFTHKTLEEGDGRTLALLIGASSLLYAGGVALNDVADHRIDAEERSWRPIPSGRVPLGVARGLGWGLLAAGAAAAGAAAWSAGSVWPGVVGLALAASVVLYNFVLKRTPLGPVLMGSCRMLNVLLGMSTVWLPCQPVHLLVAAGIGVYVAGITWFARSEAQQSSRLRLVLALGVMLAGLGVLAAFPQWLPRPMPWSDKWLMLMGALALLTSYRSLFAIAEPSPARVQMAVKQGIMSLIVLDAVVVVLVHGIGPGVMIVLLMIPAVLLGRFIYST